ncbi:MAG: PIG-L family deacetylase [Chloroflexota bacterium]
MATTPYDHIYLSPHLDDAVLSCGGMICAQARGGARVAVVTFFAASPADDELTPFTRDLKARWGTAADPVAVRRAEDVAAVRALGAEAVHLPLADCVYRHSPHGDAYYPTVETIFGDIHPAEATWHEGLRAALLDAVGTAICGAAICGAATVYAPLGAGHHVDHLLVQRVALSLAAASRAVLLYEDYPYAEDAAAIARAVGALPARRWTRRVRAYGEPCLAARMRAVACYASQINTFWQDAAGRADLAAMRAALRRYALAVGGGRPGEGYWSLNRAGLSAAGVGQD